MLAGGRRVVRTRNAMEALRRLLGALALGAAFGAPAQVPVTGQEVPVLASVDASVLEWMARRQIPGAAVAIARDGRLVYSRGFGWADLEARSAVEPDTPFRAMSISKMITGAAVVRLAAAGKLRLSDRAVEWLAGDLAGKTLADPRIAQVTLRQLLEHTWGVDRTVSSDISGGVLVRDDGQVLTRCPQIIQWDLPRRRLDFDPGTRFAYNNYGFCIASRIVELASGRDYEGFVRDEVLRAAAVSEAYVGQTLREALGPREARYYDRPGAPKVHPLPYVYPNNQAPALVDRQYGGWFEVPGYLGAGAWVISAPDYLRFVLALRGWRLPALVDPGWRDEMFRATDPVLTTTVYPCGQGCSCTYGLGVLACPVPGMPGTLRIGHSGEHIGSRTYFGTDGGRTAVVMMFNATPTDDLSGAYLDEVTNAVWQSIAAVRDWPAHDLFVGASTPPSPATGWWWNPAESGRGFAIERRHDHLFFAGYLYDADGRATWVSSAGTMTAPDRYEGRLLAFGNGQTLDGPYRPPGAATDMGAVSLAFTDAGTGTLTWPGGAVPIRRFEFAPKGLASAPAVFQPEGGWWWNPQESGRGFALEMQGDTLFVAGYMYEAAGNPVWYASAGKMAGERRFEGRWARYGNGQTMTGPFRAPTLVDADVGALTLEFQTTTSATMTLPDGRQLLLRRLVF